MLNYLQLISKGFIYNSVAFSLSYSLSLSDEGLALIKTKYEIRIQRIRKGESQGVINKSLADQLQVIQHELVNKERALIMQMRTDGLISEESLRKLEYELDLDEARLILEDGLK